MPLVNFWKKFRSFSFDFRQNFVVRTFSRWLSIRGTKFFLRDIQKFFSKMFTWVLLDGFLNGFPKLGFFIVEICILIRDFWVIFENAHAHAEHTRKQFYRTLSIQRTNFRVCSASGNILTVFTCTAMLSIRGNDLSHPEYMRKWFYRWLSIRGNDFIADWAYVEMFKSRIFRPNRIRFSKISVPFGP